MSESELVGKTIEKIYLNAEKNLIAFKCFDSTISYRVEGDCCSCSWVEHLSVTKLPFKVSFIKEHCLGEDKQDIRDDHKRVLVYSTILVDCENKKTIVLEYRNDSNGYYGGYLERIKDDELSSQILSESALEDVSNGYNIDGNGGFCEVFLKDDFK